MFPHGAYQVPQETFDPGGLHFIQWEGEAMNCPIRFSPPVVLLLTLALTQNPAEAQSKCCPVIWQPKEGTPGSVLIVRLTGARNTPGGQLGQSYLTFSETGNGRHVALVGIDMEAKPGSLPWRVEVVDRGKRLRMLTGRLRIRPREFPVQRLTLPKEKVELDDETLRRVEVEAARTKEVLTRTADRRLWRGPFLHPLREGGAFEAFGHRRIINGLPRMPHSGGDISVPAGTPILAPNAGRVAMVDEQFFAGRMVILDHGLGLYTMFLHMEDVSAKPDQAVEKGQPIGTVGATGRATGPHLHFGVRLGAARVDPESLLVLPLTE